MAYYLKYRTANGEGFTKFQNSASAKHELAALKKDRAFKDLRIETESGHKYSPRKNALKSAIKQDSYSSMMKKIERMI